MPTYNINYTDTSKDPIVVDEGSINEHALDIALIGRIRLEYGERLNQNLLNLLENFSSDADPSLVPSTPTPMPTTSVTPSGLPVSLTPTPTVTRTPTRTVSVSASVAVTATPTATPTPTPGSPSVTPTITVTPTIGVSPTPTITVTPTQTPALTVTPTPSPVFTIDLNDVPNNITGFKGLTPANASLTFNDDGTFTVVEHNGPDDGLIGDWTSGIGDDYELYYTYTEGSIGGDVGDPGPGAGVWVTFPVEFYAADHESTTENSYSINITIRKISDHTDTKSITIFLNADGSCFAVGTQILTPTGLVSIESLNVGDSVASYNVPTMLDETEENWKDWTTTNISGITLGTSIVTAKRIFTSSEGVSINGLVTTKDHVYFTFDGINYGWKNASNVTETDKLVSDDGVLLDIIEILPISGDVQYVALDVETDDTLIVETHGTHVLAHNASA